MTATAADDIAVTSVQFLRRWRRARRGGHRGPVRSVVADRRATNGAHTLTAVARDAAGHETTTTISVAVLNDTAAPTVAVTSPTDGATVGATVTVTADGVG